jgi:hypothetical protein
MDEFPYPAAEFRADGFEEVGRRQVFRPVQTPAFSTQGSYSGLRYPLSAIMISRRGNCCPFSLLIHTERVSSSGFLNIYLSSARYRFLLSVAVRSANVDKRPTKRALLL